MYLSHITFAGGSCLVASASANDAVKTAVDSALSQDRKVVDPVVAKTWSAADLVGETLQSMGVSSGLLRAAAEHYRLHEPECIGDVEVDPNARVRGNSIGFKISVSPAYLLSQIEWYAMGKESVDSGDPRVVFEFADATAAENQQNRAEQLIAKLGLMLNSVGDSLDHFDFIHQVGTMVDAYQARNRT